MLADSAVIVIRSICHLAILQVAQRLGEIERFFRGGIDPTFHVIDPFPYTSGKQGSSTLKSTIPVVFKLWSWRNIREIN